MPGDGPRSAAELTGDLIHGHALEHLHFYDTAQLWVDGPQARKQVLELAQIVDIIAGGRGVLFNGNLDGAGGERTGVVDEQALHKMRASPKNASFSLSGSGSPDSGSARILSNSR